jgi:hypothetical protein
MQRLLDWCLKRKYDRRFSEDCEEYVKLLHETSFLDDQYQEVPFEQRLWHVLNGRMELEICHMCSTPTKWNIHKKSYNLTCCKLCQNLYLKSDQYKEHFRDVSMQKFGTIHPFKSDEVKQKSKKTCLERYGVESYQQTQEAKQKVKNTNLQNYGVENYFQTEDFKIKAKKTNQERYGQDFYSKTQEFKEKSKQTCFDRYGVENYGLLKRSRDKVCLEKHVKFQTLEERIKIIDNEKSVIEHASQKNQFKRVVVEKPIQKLPKIRKEISIEDVTRDDMIKWYRKRESDIPIILVKISGLTSFLDNNYSDIPLKQRIWHIKNDDFEIQKCKICSKPTRWSKYGFYKQTCSDVCQNKLYVTPEYKNKQKQTCLERYGAESYMSSDKSRKEATQNSKWFGLLQQGVGDAIYIENIDSSNHLLECKLCGQRFEYNVRNDRIRYGYILCPMCNPVKKPFSSSEKDLFLFIQSIYFDEIQENSRSVIPPYELDIFLPDLNLAIEFDGVYYHSDVYKPDDYHKTKTELCEKAGVRLVHIFEDDWNYKQEIMKSILQNMIHPQSNPRIQARKCLIKEADLQETNDFLGQNHIQGSVLVQTVCYGLYCDDVLVSLMSFKKNKDGFELQRYGILLGHTIVGGAEKLFTYFVRTHNPEFVITYADISLFTGKIYSKLGLEKIRRNKPNYMFVNGGVRIPKQSIRKLKHGYKREDDPIPRIYNSGIDVYEYKPQ